LRRCPWCYIGEQRLSTAIEESAHTDDIELTIHTYELDPAGTTQVTPTVQRLAETYGVSAAQARAIEEGVAKQAAAEG
jgi:predicted DsbA family dithiol-disulfide isomerase